jgi:hypothetical protein
MLNQLWAATFQYIGGDVEISAERCPFFEYLSVYLLPDVGLIVFPGNADDMKAARVAAILDARSPCLEVQGELWRLPHPSRLHIPFAASLERLALFDFQNIRLNRKRSSAINGLMGPGAPEARKSHEALRDDE